MEIRGKCQMSAEEKRQAALEVTNHQGCVTGRPLPLHLHMTFSFCYPDPGKRGSLSFFLECPRPTLSRIPERSTPECALETGAVRPD